MSDMLLTSLLSRSVYLLANVDPEPRGERTLSRCSEGVSDAEVRGEYVRCRLFTQACTHQTTARYCPGAAEAGLARQAQSMSRYHKDGGFSGDKKMQSITEE